MRLNADAKPTSETVMAENVRMEVTFATMLYPGATPVPGYRLIAPLGRGSYGVVWKAERLETDAMEDMVALKFVDISNRQGEREFRNLKGMMEAVKRKGGDLQLKLAEVYKLWLLNKYGEVLDDAKFERASSAARAKVAQSPPESSKGTWIPVGSVTDTVTLDNTPEKYLPVIRRLRSHECPLALI